MPRRPWEAAPPVEPVAGAAVLTPPAELRNEGTAAKTETPVDWWPTLAPQGRRPMHSTGIGAMLLDSVMADLSAMPVVQGPDLDTATDAFAAGGLLSLLASPLDDAAAAWRRHERSLLCWGRTHWLLATEMQVEDETMRAQWQGGPWWVLCDAPSAKRSREGVWTLTHQTGIQFSADERRGDKVVTCTWWDDVRPKGVRSLLSPLIEYLQLLGVGVGAAWTALDNARQSRMVIEMLNQDIPGKFMGETDRGQPIPRTVAHDIFDDIVERAQAVEKGSRSFRERLPLIFQKPQNSSGPSVTLSDLTPKVDGALVPLADWALRQVAISSLVPTPKVTGEDPKFANAFSNRAEFVGSALGEIARALCGATGPLLRAALPDLDMRDRLFYDPADLITMVPDGTPTAGTPSLPVQAQALVSAAATSTIPDSAVNWKLSKKKVSS